MTLVLEDWWLGSDGAIVEDRGNDLHAAARGGRMGNTVTVNGAACLGLAMRLMSGCAYV